MASCAPLRFLQPPSLPKPRRPHPRLRLPTVACAPAASPPDPPTRGFEPHPQPYEAAAPPVLDLEPRRRRSGILRERRPGTALERPKPPNFQIGWKRTKEINNEKPKGWVIADFLDKLESLMGRGQYGSVALLAKVGGIVAERAREEADVLVEGGEVEERKVTELDRVLKLMEMDLEMVKAAVKEETLKERVETARARCRQAILVAMSF
ncbi:hypothetical protein Taro_032262 [Colocasia esculenta]|uniref:Chlororespiratory reduction 41 n=1 Tax=Colocasia esculenta TaxID=4460 RepID=A0A843W8Z0_COLES|nr:hypothetical protein [Colocasia esculenta]